MTVVLPGHAGSPARSPGWPPASATALIVSVVRGVGLSGTASVIWTAGFGRAARILDVIGVSQLAGLT
jgi:hypothetical protein